jgi:hypothetical protein
VSEKKTVRKVTWEIRPNRIAPGDAALQRLSGEFSTMRGNESIFLLPSRTALDADRTKV